jgi:NodT family efflux transporter outer membrane factor (OMF) lipoprotein
MKLRRIHSPASLALLCATGCMVGPKYVKPTTPMSPAYKENAPELYKEDSNWHPAQPADAVLKGDWWTIFNDSELNALEPQIVAANQSLKAAEAHFRAARAQITYNRANLAPTISAAPFAGGERESANRPYFNPSSASNTGDIQLPLELSYEVDLWGRIRRTINASREEAQASAADLQTAKLSLQAELAVDYFEARTADAQEKLLNDTVKDYEEAFRITTNRFEGGVSGESDVDQAKTQLETARVQARDVAIIRAQFEHAIAILIGQPPAALTLPPAPLEIVPPSIPAGLPSQLLERRPDIASSERRAAEANEQIGIARAAYFPSLSLSGSAGFESTSLLNLFTPSSFIYALGPALGQTFFDGGRRHGLSEQALAGYDRTVADYRETVLVAYQQVEDNLVALRVLSDEAEQQRQATASARESERIFNNRYVGGVDTYLQVITAQTTALTNERNDIDILRRRMEASILLVKALGGGWDRTQLPPR